MLQAREPGTTCGAGGGVSETGARVGWGGWARIFRGVGGIEEFSGEREEMALIVLGHC